MSEEEKKDTVAPVAEEKEEEPKAAGAPKEEAAVKPSSLVQPEDAKPVNQDKQWYVVNTYSGREREVAASLESRKNSLNFKNQIFRIVVAENEEEVLDKNGKDTGKKKIINLYPGYIFIEMIMSDEAWYMVRNTPDVTGFVGSSGGGTKPFPVPKEEIEPVLKRMKIADEDMFTDYQVGDNVKILSGTFEDSEGPIVSIDKANSEVTVQITFFGRLTPITAKFSEIEKI